MARATTQLVLLAGFGSLLAMMFFAGIDSIGVLRKIENRSQQIAKDTGAQRAGETGQSGEALAQSFNQFRKRLVAVLAITMALGLGLTAMTTYYVVGMARRADVRLREVERARRELKEFSARLVQIQEQERRTLSRELHDEVGQSLSALLMEIGNLGAVAPRGNTEFREHLASIKQLAENSVKVVRNMALLLRPSMLDDLGLVPALQWQARETTKRTGMEVTVTADNVPDDLPEEHKTCIYRVVQEALHNCTSHAEARNVRIAVLYAQDKLLLSVEDDGKGFDGTQVRGMGLLGIEERAAHLGGTFVLDSRPGHGTSLKIELPLAEAECKSGEASA